MCQASALHSQCVRAIGAVLIGLFAIAGQASPDELPSAGTAFTDCAGCPEMVVVPAGSFTMGSQEKEDGRHSDEEPLHAVTIAKPFAVSRLEITLGQYSAFVEATGHKAGDTCWIWVGTLYKNVKGKSFRDPGYEQADDHPVACISWYDAQAYAAWLSAETHQNYRLLSEAEWEYAARAGTASAFATGDVALTKKQAHFDAGGAVSVGNYDANGFGLQDMHGNVWEWVQDCYVDSYKNAPEDGSSIKDFDRCKRVNRGGGWGDYPKYLRSASRGWDTPSSWYSVVGFRLARTL
jgi:formylglycine-generating enzyme required for sulfatase activity